MSQTTSDSIPDLAQLHSNRNRSSKDYPGEKGGKSSLCGPEHRKWLCESVRPSLGTSMIVFAVPLLLPGITLTAVGFDEDASFSKYGALHVIGIILLSLSGFLMLTGIFLNIRFHDKISPEDAETQLVSTHDTKVSSRSGQSQDMSVVSLEHKDPPPRAVLASFMVDAGQGQGHSSVRHYHDHHVSFGATQVGAAGATLRGSGRMLEGDESDLAQSPTSRDFQPSSILSSPRGVKSPRSPASSQHCQFFPADPTQSDAPPVHDKASSYHLLNRQRGENFSDNDSGKLPSLDASCSSPRKFPEITLKRPDSHSVPLAEDGPTEDVAMDEISSLDPVRCKSNKKGKRKKKKRHERLLTQEGEDAPTAVDDSSNALQFSIEDPTGFLSIDKKNVTSSQTSDNPIRNDAGLAYRSNIGSHTQQQQANLLSIPRTVYKVADREGGSDDKYTPNLVQQQQQQQHSSAPNVEEEEKDQQDTRKLPRKRRHREPKSSNSGVPPVPPPTYSSLNDPSTLASISNSVGTVTQLYTLDASNSRNDNP